jgi:phosphate transport system substrate-binding protein
MWSPDAQGKVKKWNQVRSSFPDAPLKLYGPGADSGTFDYFTEAINGKAKQSRSDFTGSEDDNVLVQGVSRDKNALGYFGFAYYEANRSRLKAVKVNGVAPSIANVDNGTYTPLSRPIFIYVNADAAKKPEVKAFVEYYMKNARSNVAAVKYIPFKPTDYTRAMTRFQKTKSAAFLVARNRSVSKWLISSPVSLNRCIDDAQGVALVTPQVLTILYTHPGASFSAGF